jgi:hypothetical protein
MSHFVTAGTRSHVVRRWADSRGTIVKFMLYVNNRGGAVTDISLRDVMDPAFVYQTGTIKLDGSVTGCVADTCTVAEEAAVFASVDAQAPGTDAVDGDSVGYTAGSATIDAGNQDQPNQQLDVGANRVLAILFSVRVQ